MTAGGRAVPNAEPPGHKPPRHAKIEPPFPDMVASPIVIKSLGYRELTAIMVNWQKGNVSVKIR